jgi:hypothetical protein
MSTSSFQTCEINGLPVDVYYDYEPAQDGGIDDPSWSAYVTIEAVMCHDVDIKEYLTDETVNAFSDEIYAGITDPS